MEAFFYWMKITPPSPMAHAAIGDFFHPRAHDNHKEYDYLHSVAWQIFYRYRRLVRTVDLTDYKRVG